MPKIYKNFSRCNIYTQSDNKCLCFSLSILMSYKLQVPTTSTNLKTFFILKNTKKKLKKLISAIKRTINSSYSLYRDIMSQ